MHTTLNTQNTRFPKLSDHVATYEHPTGIPHKEK